MFITNRPLTTFASKGEGVCTSPVTLTDAVRCRPATDDCDTLPTRLQLTLQFTDLGVQPIYFTVISRRLFRVENILASCSTTCRLQLMTELG